MPIPHTPRPATAGPPTPIARGRPPGPEVDRDIAQPGEQCDAWSIALHGEIDADAVTRLQSQVSDAVTGDDRGVLELPGGELHWTPADMPDGAPHAPALGDRPRLAA